MPAPDFRRLGRYVMNRVRARVALLLIPAAIMAGGCAPGGGSPGGATAPTSTTSSTTQATTAAAAITIRNFDFGAPVSVPPGAVVSVVNMDSAAHTVTADHGPAFDVDIRGGGTATFTAPTAPGTYAYHCTYHPNMHGTLTVK
jgi:plastocyanin